MNARALMPAGGSGAGEPGPSLELADVSVVYPDGNVALRDASLRLSGGRVAGLVGLNGSGKSTLFKTLMGIERPARGRVAICGRPVRAALKAGLVAYVPQAEDVDWDFPFLVEDVVLTGRYGRMGWLRRPSPEDRRAVDRALARVGLEPLRRRQIGELSGGQKKRAFLARALAQDAPVVLLDEPFAGVDVASEAAIVSILKDIAADGTLVLVSTHDLGSVPGFCEEVVLVAGTVVAAGPTREVFTPANLERVFGGVLRRLRLGGDQLHDDADARALTVLSDDERPLVFYGHGDRVRPRESPSAAQEPSK